MIVQNNNYLDRCYLTKYAYFTHIHPHEIIHLWIEKKSIFINLKGNFMNKSVSKLEKLQVISKNCKNKILMDELINEYQSSTKSAVENILTMCRAVKEIDEKRKANLINDFDVMYFGATVSLDPKSPTYRKYRQIGSYADKFQKYIDCLPSAYTVLFQITTLEAEKFEQLIESNQITPSLSLEQLKKLTSPQVANQQSDEANFKVVFNTKKMSDTTKKFLVETLASMLTYEDIEIVVPDKSRPYFGKDTNFTKSNKLGMWSVQSVNTPKLNSNDKKSI